MKYVRKNYKIILLTVLPILLQGIFFFSTKLLIHNPLWIGSKLDLKIPYISQFVYLYVAWYIMLVVVPLIVYQHDQLAFKKYIVSLVISLFIAFLFFFIFPTTISRAEITSNTFSDNLVKLIYKADTPAVNCLPSIHCIICYLFIAACLISKNMGKLLKTIIIIISLGVVASTLFIHQHVLYDVLASLILSTAVYLVVSRLNLQKCLDKILEGKNDNRNSL